MTQETYEFILHTLKVNYSTFNGIIGQLRVPGYRFPWSLCLSTLRNEGKLTPDSCCLWNCDKLLFAGKLSSRKLRRILMEADPCRLEITNSKDMENGHGDFVCLCDSFTCKQSCECRAEHYYEELLKRRPELSKETVKMKQPEFKSIVEQTWKAGMKEAEKIIKHGNLSFGK